MAKKKEEIKETQTDQLDKELKTEDNIITRHTNKDTRQFNFGTALLELEKEILTCQKAVEDRDLIIGKLEVANRKLEDGMAFFADWWEKTYGKSIIIPTNDELNLFKSKK